MSGPFIRELGPADEIAYWQERASTAEAEVERLKTEVAFVRNPSRSREAGNE